VFVAGETVSPGVEELGAEALVKTASGLLDALNGLDLSVASDGEVRDARDRPEHRRASVAKTLGGCVAADAWLDPVNGEIFYTAFNRIERELFEADWAAAKARLGRDPKPHELDRTPAQRRADVLVEMAQRAVATPEGSRKPAPLVTILVGTERFARMCELLDGTVVRQGGSAPFA
jgi:hypothetical protein